MKKRIIHYSISTAINKGILLLFFPFLTQFLSLAEFGKWSLIIVVANLLMPILSLNGVSGILREGSHSLEMAFSLFVRFFVITTLLSVLVLLITYKIVGINWIFLSVFLGFAESLFAIGLTYIRAWEKSLLYLIFSIAKSFLLFLVVLYAKSYDLNLFDLLYRYIGVIFIIDTILFLYIFFNRIDNKKKDYLFYPILIFGITLIPHSMSQWIMSSSDRIVIEYLLNSKSLGIYSLAYNLASILMLLNSGIALALPPFMIKNFEKWKKEKYDLKIMNYYSILSVVLFFIILALFLIDKTYFHFIGYYGNEIVLLIAVIYFSIYILGLYYFYANYLFYYKKGVIISKVTFYAGAINLILTFLFVYIFGIFGAAVATLFAYFFYLYKIRYEALKIELDIDMPLFKNISLVMMIIFFISIGYYYVQ